MKDLAKGVANHARQLVDCGEILRVFGEVQLSPTEAHHVCHGRFSQRKTPDRMAIALCNGHHTGDRDSSKLAIHRAKETWAERYGFDFDYSAATRDRVDALDPWRG